MSGQKADVEQLTPVLRSVGVREGLDHINVEFKEISNKGDGYIGSINFLQINGIKNGKRETIDVAVKAAPKKENLRENFCLNNVFKMEKFMYMNVMEEFSKLEDAYNVKDKFRATPRCYYASDEEYNEMIVLENLRTSGFELKPIAVHMNKEHLELVMKQYGKWHALSFAMKHKDPKKFESLVGTLSQNKMLLDFIKDSSTTRKNFMLKIANFLKENKGDKLALEVEKFAEVIENLDKIVTYKDEYAVLTHGDCWGNNFMFKYDGDKTKPIDVRMLDWQCSMPTCAVTDLGYFFYAASGPDNYSNYKHFLEIYYQSFKQHLSNFDIKAEDVFPFQEILNQWYLGLIYGVNNAVLIFKIMLIGDDEIPDLDEEIGKGNDIVNSFCTEFSKTNEQMVKCKELFEAIYKNGLLQDAIENFKNFRTNKINRSINNNIRLESALEEVAKSERLKDYKITVKEGTNAGDGYSGLLNFAEIHGTKIQTGKETTLNVILKYTKKTENEFMRTATENMFKMESYVYTDVLKEYLDFQLRNNVLKRFVSYPKHFLTIYDEDGPIIILEDIKKLGFEMWDRRVPMNMPHIKFVFKEYAKFHAISFAMKTLEPDRFHGLAKAFKSNPIIDYLSMSEEMLKKNYYKIAKILEENGKTEVSDALIKHAEVLRIDITDVLSPNDHSVINHGDSWTNNMMFKYDSNDKSKPSKVRLIDFQCSAYASPVADLVYYFYACSAPILFDHIDDLMDVYHLALDDYLGYYNLNAESIFPKTKLRSEWTRCCRYAFLMSSLVYKVQLVEMEEVPEIVDGKDPTEEFFAEFSKTDEVNRRLCALAEHLHKIKAL